MQFYQHKTSQPAYDSLCCMIVSAFARLMKPDRRIFEQLAYTHGIALEESLYVDDVSQNVVAAERVGMRGMVYTGDPSDMLERPGHYAGARPTVTASAT